jgi:hypothetical protein
MGNCTGAVKNTCSVPLRHVQLVIMIAKRVFDSWKGGKIQDQGVSCTLRTGIPTRVINNADCFRDDLIRHQCKALEGQKNVLVAVE